MLISEMKSQPAKREKGKGTPYDLAEISLDQAPRARTYARTARHETISRLGSPLNLRYIYIHTDKPNERWIGCLGGEGKGKGKARQPQRETGKLGANEGKTEKDGASFAIQFP